MTNSPGAQKKKKKGKTTPLGADLHMQSARGGKINNLCLEACECDMTRIIKRGGTECSGGGNISEHSQLLHFGEIARQRGDARVGVQRARSSN